MKPHIHLKVSFVLFLVGLLVGVYFAIQIKAVPTRVTNPFLPYTSLKEASQSLAQEIKELRKEIVDLHSEINQAEAAIKASEKISKSLIYELEQAKSQAGLTALSGPGVEVILDDAPLANSSEKVITAADIRDVVNLLWLAGAEAIAVGEERLVATSSIDAVSDVIFVNDIRLMPPFRIKAIGNPSKLHGYLVNPNYLKDLHHRVESYQLTFKVEEQKNLIVPAYSGVLKSQFVKVEQ